jgi:hypothetical protein
MAGGMVQPAVAVAAGRHCRSPASSRHSWLRRPLAQRVVVSQDRSHLLQPIRACRLGWPLIGPARMGESADRRGCHRSAIPHQSRMARLRAQPAFQADLVVPHDILARVGLTTKSAPNARVAQSVLRGSIRPRGGGVGLLDAVEEALPAADSRVQDHRSGASERGRSSDFLQSLAAELGLDEFQSGAVLPRHRCDPGLITARATFVLNPGLCVRWIRFILLPPHPRRHRRRRAERRMIDPSGFFSRLYRSRPWSSQPWNGSTGSTAAGSCSPSRRPACRNRRLLLRHLGRTTHRGLTQTKYLPATRPGSILIR